MMARITQALCALVVTFVTAGTAHAQTMAVAPSRLSLTTLAAAPHTPPPRFFGAYSLRVAFGGAVGGAAQGGGAFALQATMGSRVLLSDPSHRTWVLGPDLGIDTTWGFDARDATLTSLGFSVGHLWGLHGVAVTPRALYGWRDGGDTVWGARTGVRTLIVGGIFDLEVAHQFVSGELGDEHAVFFTIGFDVGLFGWAMSQMTTPHARPPRAVMAVMPGANMTAACAPTAP